MYACGGELKLGRTLGSSSVVLAESQSAMTRRVNAEAQTSSPTVGREAMAVAAKRMLERIDEGIVRDG